MAGFQRVLGKELGATPSKSLDDQVRRNLLGAEKKIQNLEEFASLLEKQSFFDREDLNRLTSAKNTDVRNIRRQLDAISSDLEKDEASKLCSDYQGFVARSRQLHVKLAELDKGCNNLLREKLRILDELDEEIRRISGEIVVLAKNRGEQRKVLNKIALSLGFSLAASEKREVVTKQGVTEEATLPLPEKAPALWAARTTGREVSPVDFIQQHYAPWIGKGLARADIKRFDPKLYDAYSSWIRPDRHPDDALPLIEATPQNRIEDPHEAIERRRCAQREANRRYRQQAR